MILYNEPFVTYYVREAEMSVQMNIKRQPVIQRRYLTIDLQCCTVILSGEQITLYPKEFDVLYLLAQYPGWVLSPEQIYGAV